MALSDDDERSLRELENYTRAADPAFAASLGGITLQRLQEWRTTAAWTALLLGIFAVMVGIGAAQGLISTGTIIAGYGCLLTIWGAVAAVKVLRSSGTEPARRSEPC